MLVLLVAKFSGSKVSLVNVRRSRPISLKPESCPTNCCHIKFFDLCPPENTKQQVLVLSHMSLFKREADLIY